MNSEDSAARLSQVGFDGVREYSKEIITILKRCSVIDSYKLIEELGIDIKDSEIIKTISKQLEELEGYGLVASTKRGWKWLG